mgnify:CR=1 FL=1
MKHTLFANIGDINWKISYQHSYVEEHYRDYRIDPVEDAIPLEVTEGRFLSADRDYHTGQGSVFDAWGSNRIW